MTEITDNTGMTELTDNTGDGGDDGGGRDKVTARGTLRER